MIPVLYTLYKPSVLYTFLKFSKDAKIKYKYYEELNYLDFLLN